MYCDLASRAEIELGDHPSMSAQSDGYISEIAQIWTNSYPPAAPRQRYLLEKLIATPIIASRLLSLDRTKRFFGDKTRHNFMDCYVLAFAVLLTVLVMFPAHFREHVPRVVESGGRRMG